MVYLVAILGTSASTIELQLRGSTSHVCRSRPASGRFVDLDGDGGLMTT